MLAKLRPKEASAVGSHSAGALQLRLIYYCLLASLYCCSHCISSLSVLPSLLLSFHSAQSIVEGSHSGLLSEIMACSRGNLVPSWRRHRDLNLNSLLNKTVLCRRRRVPALWVGC